MLRGAASRVEWTSGSQLKGGGGGCYFQEVKTTGGW